jgi:hypothetical protein
MSGSLQRGFRPGGEVATRGQDGFTGTFNGGGMHATVGVGRGRPPAGRLPSSWR